MMRPLDLEEFAQQLRMEGNEFADEILELCTLQEEVADPYGELCDALEQYVPDNLKARPARAVEWLGDRSDELAEIETIFPGVDNVIDTIRERIDTLDNIETAMRERGGWTEGDLLDALFALIERAPKVAMEYDL